MLRKEHDFLDRTTGRGVRRAATFRQLRRMRNVQLGNLIIDHTDHSCHERL